MPDLACSFKAKHNLQNVQHGLATPPVSYLLSILATLPCRKCHRQLPAIEGPCRPSDFIASERDRCLQPEYGLKYIPHHVVINNEGIVTMNFDSPTRYVIADG